MFIIDHAFLIFLYPKATDPKEFSFGLQSSHSAKLYRF